MLRLDGIDFAEAKDKGQASSFSFILWEFKNERQPAEVAWTSSRDHHHTLKLCRWPMISISELSKQRHKTMKINLNPTGNPGLKPKRRRLSIRKLVLQLFIFLVCLITFGLIGEIYSSIIQAHYFSNLSEQMTYELGTGESKARISAPDGPYDLRLGYTSLPDFSRNLKANDFDIARQAQVSETMIKLVDKGLFPIYPEKIQAGMTIFDRHDHPIFSQKYPKRIFSSFSEIPPIVVDILLFIENRTLLDEDRPFANPAIDWVRLGNAVYEQGKKLAYRNGSVSGGSTLATQLEKFRHSKNGISYSMKEKFQQISSATLRAYLGGENTFARRRQIALDYINSVPLAGNPDYGEIFGLGDGLWVWYARELKDISIILNTTDVDNNPSLLKEKAVALKQVLSLFIAHRRPTDFLLRNREALEAKCNAYIRLLYKYRIISEALMQSMLEVKLNFRASPLPLNKRSLIEQKAADSLRTKLLSLLDIDSLFTLDRLDASVKSTLDLDSQEAVTRQMMKFHDPEWIKEKNLNAPRLLDRGDPEKIIYSFTLYEKTPQANLLRVQTDNYNQPFNINQGSKLNLGSTAKLRTLIHYLEIIAALHERYHGLNKKELRQLKSTAADKISQWAVSYLLRTGDKTIETMLESALNRTYSASPYEVFYTGGGVHRFSNFNEKDNQRTVSLSNAFRRSVNLVFIRLMRDIVNHHIYQGDRYSNEMLRNADHPNRKAYLDRFVEHESTLFLHRFYKKYHPLSQQKKLELLHDVVRPSFYQRAALLRFVFPDMKLDDFKKRLQNQMSEIQLKKTNINRLYYKYDPQKRSLSDVAHLAGIHPLELWLVAYLWHHPNANYEAVYQKSKSARLDAYGWLYRTSRKYRQDKRIRIILEQDAFESIHRAWQRLGYPFKKLVPSYATAIGSSADRPEALAELMGIIVNEGIYKPAFLIQEITFADGTPYETHFVRKAAKAKRVLHPKIADLIKKALFNVVEGGTAKQVYQAFFNDGGPRLPVGGKTGTGDNQHKELDPDGMVISSKFINRTATFAFIIGDRFFGNITAYVPGPQAEEYSFTSSLPVALLKNLAGDLKGALNTTDMSTLSAK
ncbi:MAG: transglycosylase domain-containing protein, partial [Desulfobacterales bacterium]